LIINSHHRSAEHGHDNHEEPARNQVEEPENVADNGRESILGKPSVERVEDTIMQLARLLVSVLLQLDEIVARDGGHVEPLGPEVDRCRRRQHLENPEGARRCGPGVAEDGFVLAVKQSGMGSTRSDGKLGRSLVEGGLDPLAVAFASKNVDSSGMNIWKKRQVTYRSKFCSHQ
jgi:hypothetical protein